MQVITDIKGSLEALIVAGMPPGVIDNQLAPDAKGLIKKTSKLVKDGITVTEKRLGDLKQYAATLDKYAAAEG